MRIKRLLRKLISSAVIIAMVLGLLPLQAIRVRAGSVNVTRAVIYGEYSGYDLKSMLVQVSVEGDSGTYSVSYDDTAGVKYTLGDVVIPGTTGGSADRTFTITGTSLLKAVNIKNLYIGAKVIPANYCTLPSIKSTSATFIDEGESVNLAGENFDKLLGTVTMDIEGATFSSPPLVSTPTDITLFNIRREGSSATQSIVFREDKDINGTSVIVSRKYSGIFRVIQNMDMNLKYTPTQGEAGSTIYISFNNDTDVFDNYSVFFLKDSDEGYSSANMVKASDISYTQDRKFMKVKVPNLSSQSYIIQLTNYISGETGDLSSLVTKRQTLGSFFITGVGVSPVIKAVDPTYGPNSGDNVQIIGKNFEELTFIEGFSNAVLPTPQISTVVEEAAASLIPGNSSALKGTPVEKLVIRYDGVVDDYGNTVNVIRKITAFIGTDATFSPADCVLSSTGDRTDILYVKTKPTSDENKTVDVYLTLETVKEDAAGQVSLPGYMAIKESAYKYIPSYVYPSIDTVSPDMIQVESGGSAYQTKEDMVVGIHGSDFKVYKNKDDDGKDVVNYPIIGIGGDLNNNAADIALKKIGDKVYKPNPSGQFVQDDQYVVDGASIEILNANGIVVDGSQGNDTGTSIIVTIPKGREVTYLGKKPVAVKNPVLKSSGNGNDPTVKVDAVEFTALSGSYPVIDSVTPRVTTVDSGETITVTGSNFNKDVRVFISGREVPKSSIKYEVGADGRSTALKVSALKAPLVKEGSTLLMVMNPNGAIAVSSFTYVKTFNQDPKITEFSPEKGTEKTVVVVNGDNFMKPNPAVSGVDGMGIYQLIGSRILMDGYDINEYETGSGSQAGEPQLTPFTSFSNDKILQQNTPGILTLSDYYHSIILKDANGSFYTLDTDNSGNIVLSNGGSTSSTNLTDKFIFGLDEQAEDGITKPIIASNNGISYTVNVQQDYIDLQSFSGGDALKFTMYTIYKKTSSSEGDKITGNRVKVINKSRLIFTVPRLEGKSGGGYTVTVQNPDTKKGAASKLFYYYSEPQSRFKITSITPAMGSVDGGYCIAIKGEPLEATSKVFESTSKVYINGILVSAADTQIDSLGTTITAKVPAYPGSLSDEGVDTKAVPVVVVNEDGGTAYIDNGFTYVIPYSNPKINKIEPVDGSAAGGEVVEIWGYDFRFYEPKSTWKKNNNWLPHKDSEGNILFYYFDIDNEGSTSSWDGFTTNLGVPNVSNFIGGIDPVIQGYSTYIKTPIIPKVYFGSKEAKVVEFSNSGYIKVLTPQSGAGTVDVYLVNNDYGVSNKIKYTYKSSSPKINSITPAMGRKKGKDKVEVIGSGFAMSTIKIYDDDGDLTNVTQPLIRFGDITNKNLSRTDSNSGLVNGGTASVKLAGGLEARYNAPSSTLTITVKSNDIEYQNTYMYEEKTVFIPLMQLKNGSDELACFELLKVEFIDGRLIVERGYSPLVDKGKLPGEAYVSSEQLAFMIPSYYTVGEVNVTLINPDGGSAVIKFTYKNPESDPSIVNILKEENQPTDITSSAGVIEKKLQKVTCKGGNIITIVGTDFRENAVIKISDVATITKENITYNLPGRLTFTMPSVPESAMGKEHRVLVINDDGGTAASDADIPPIYIVFTKGETSPVIDSITPDKGTSSGGTKVKISGSDFRKTMEGIDSKALTVYFGDTRVTGDDILYVDYKTIYVLTPAHSPGTVQVKVENPDGELAVSPVSFTFLSNPKIVSVLDPEDDYETIKIENISVEGGQQIKVKGSGFAEGARVVFIPTVKAAASLSEDSKEKIIYIEGKPFILEKGTDAKAVQLIDSETLLVTTPEGFMGTRGIIVVNADGGASSIYEDLVYDIPALDAPTGVRAELVYDRYIKVYWNGVSKATEYEVQAVIGENETELVGVTKLTSFMYQDLRPDTSYKFIIKAVGALGSSKASRESNTVKTGAIAGRPDNDGSISDKNIIIKNGETAEVSIGVLEYKAKAITIDLTRGTLSGSKKVAVSIPASVVVKDDARDITIIGKDFTLVFNPKVFAASKVTQNQSRNDAGVRFTVEPVNTNTQIESGSGFTAALSQQYVLKTEVFVGSTSMQLDYISGSMELIMDYDIDKAKTRKLDEIGMNRYDEGKSAWAIEEYGSNEDSCVKGRINRMGRYMIIGRRR